MTGEHDGLAYNKVHYDTSKDNTGALNRLALCYSKCIKCVLGYPKYSSVTNNLFELGLPSLNTAIHNSKVTFANNVTMLFGDVFYRLPCSC